MGMLIHVYVLFMFGSSTAKSVVGKKAILQRVVDLCVHAPVSKYMVHACTVARAQAYPIALVITSDAWTIFLYSVFRTSLRPRCWEKACGYQGSLQARPALQRAPMCKPLQVRENGLAHGSKHG